MEYENLAVARQEESPKNIKERVVRSRQIQKERFQNFSTRKNTVMKCEELEQHGQLSDTSRRMLKQAMTKMGLSARADDRILKVPRTIVDLAEKENINNLQVAEDIQYRNFGPADLNLKKSNEMQ